MLKKQGAGTYLMRLILSKILLYISCVCLLIQVVLMCAPDEASLHLNQFSEFNVTHHDNLDDDAHSHKHKHSEDGEEHEHNHEHSKIVQNDFKILYHSHNIMEKVRIIEVSHGFREKKLFSNSHPFEVFRPPIV